MPTHFLRVSAGFFTVCYCAAAFAAVRFSPCPMSPYFATFASSAVISTDKLIDSKAYVNTLAFTFA